MTHTACKYKYSTIIKSYKYNSQIFHKDLKLSYKNFKAYV